MQAMEMPKPAPEHKKLHVLAGTWIGEETLEPSPWGPGGKAEGKSVCRIDLDGFHVVQDYAETKDGKPTFKGHGVFGYDTTTKEFVWYWFDSMGFVPEGPARGKWEGDTLLLERDSPRGRSRYTYKFASNTKYNLTIENSFDGGKTFQVFMRGEYLKAS
jgi:hypothetical protein